MTLRARRRALPLAVLVTLCLNAAAQATVPREIRVELEAAAPIVVPEDEEAGTQTPSATALQAQALAAGIAEALRRVAFQLSDPSRLFQLLAEAEAPPEAGAVHENPPPAYWIRLLTGEARDYVLRYRVLERIGQRIPTTPIVLFKDDAEEPPDFEFALRLEIVMDAHRIAAALERAGLRSEPDPAPAEALRVTVQPAPSWAAWRRFRDAALATGAAQCVPVLLAAEQMVLELRSPAPVLLLGKLTREPPAGLEIQLRDATPGRLRIELALAAEREGAAPEAPDAPAD